MREGTEDSGMNEHRILTSLKAEKELYQQILSRFEKEMKTMPEGSLNCKKIRGNTYFYHYTKAEDGKRNQRFIAEDENQLKIDLKRKRFIQLSLNQLRTNIKAIDDFLGKYCPYDPANVLSMLPELFSELNYRMENIIIRSDWSNAKFEKCEWHPERLIHGTIGGLKVRSKSEAIIAGLLEINDVPFRYEAALNIGKKTYYPDFTILRPRDNRIIYWEHFGMADDEDYNLSMERKLAAYRKHGIVPWNQLIATYEIEKGSMDAKDIQSIINAFIL
jgi:hypothetical protein